jgi:hypothetical protein
VSQSWFYQWRDGDHSARRARRERLKAEIRRLFGEHKGKRGLTLVGEQNVQIRNGDHLDLSRV